MLVPILGSLSSERVLIFILTRRERYAREIARLFETDLGPIQKQLEKLELGSVLVNRGVRHGKEVCDLSWRADDARLVGPTRKTDNLWRY